MDRDRNEPRVCKDSETEDFANRHIRPKVIRELAHIFITGDGKKFTNEKEAKNHHEAEEIFKESVEHYIEGEAVHGNGSTVVDLREPGGEILREGPLKWPPSYC